MPSDEVRNTIVGSLVGLGLGALARKMVAGDQDVSWKDYAIWGSVGAGLGGATGYGITGLDTSKASPDQLAEATARVDAAAKEYAQLARNAGGPGIAQMLAPWQWGTLLGGELGAFKLNSVLHKHFKNVARVLNTQTAQSRSALKAAYIDLANAKRAARAASGNTWLTWATKPIVSFNNAKAARKANRASIQRALAAVDAAKLRVKDDVSATFKSRTLSPFTSARRPFTLAIHLIPHLTNAWIHMKLGRKSIKDFLVKGSWSKVYNKKYAALKDAEENLNKAIADRAELQSRQ